MNHPERITELPWEEVVARLQSHDKVVIQNLYKTVFPKLSGYIKKNGGNRQSAEDVFQEALMALYRNVRKPDFEINTSLTQYLFAVSKYIWIKKLKKSAKGGGTYSLDEARIYEEVQEQGFDEDERHAFLQEKILLLPKDCQQVLAYFFEGYKMEEIAEKMGYGTNEYARKRKYKCKERLIKLMKEDRRYKELLENG